MKSSANPLDALNRLLAIHYRSLPMYMVWACPYRRTEDETSWTTIGHIVDDQKQLATRIVELITDRNQRLDYGDFPITFTGSHDLALNFLVRRMVDYQKGTVAAIGQCYEALSNDPVAQALADECLGAAKGHQESLEELLAVKRRPPEVKLHEPEVAGHE